jgi:hypothetical protein
MLGKHAIALQSTLRSARAAVVEQAKGRHESSALFTSERDIRVRLRKARMSAVGAMHRGRA